MPEPKFDRRSMRLHGYDYSDPNLFFVTICTKNKVSFFGDIVEKKMQLNSLGSIVEEVWERLPGRFPHVELGEFVVMPNHFHSIIRLTDTCPVAEKVPERFRAYQRKLQNERLPLGEIIRTFKALVTRRAHLEGFPDFAWLHGFNERIIKNEEHWYNVRRYIIENPARWERDEWK